MSSIINNQEENLNTSLMVLTIDIGNGLCDKLRIHNINDYQEEAYNFCAKNNLDFNTMKEINHQIEKVLVDSGVYLNEINSKNSDIKQLYIKKSQNSIKKNNYLKNFRNEINKNNESAINKKVIKRYNEKQWIYNSKKMKDSSKNNYSYLMSTSIGSSSFTVTLITYTFSLPFSAVTLTSNLFIPSDTSISPVPDTSALSSSTLALIFTLVVSLGTSTLYSKVSLSKLGSKSNPSILRLFK